MECSQSVSRAANLTSHIRDRLIRSRIPIQSQLMVSALKLLRTMLTPRRLRGRIVRERRTRIYPSRTGTTVATISEVRCDNDSPLAIHKKFFSNFFFCGKAIHSSMELLLTNESSKRCRYIHRNSIWNAFTTKTFEISDRSS